MASPCLQAQSVKKDTLADPVVAPPVLNWAERISIRGYVQLRYNRLLETNPDLQCEQCDRSWGGDGGFFLRRVRVIFFGQVSKRVYFYLQPDFATSIGSNGLHYGQIRDAYFDIGLTPDNTLRLRLGQSKIPYGFENMQSSQNRLPLDRSDALNSSVVNERDLAVFAYWAPRHIRERFAFLVRSGLKGSGDYGVLAFGAFNGQGANRPDLNRDAHMVARVTYPFLLGKKQILEPGVQTYTGNFVLPASQVSAQVEARHTYLDQRAAASLVLYPQPIGFQAEYNVGTGPQFNPATRVIEQAALRGGYITLTARIACKNHLIYPFVRWQQYDGGKKLELDARSYEVSEQEIGIEWHPWPTFELVTMYTISSRRFEDGQQPSNLQKGSLLRLQAQLSF
ncbi:MAG: porin [Bacteroidetes bacterium]|nr:porin [Bacteroidota bacterium]